mmetsp:Transcript_89646/g.236498  ORF Transcript_89646/g.236498 Transcript_89646/m.236498 type:complete len:258 (+) Transcript_89646:1-774(+)
MRVCARGVEASPWAFVRHLAERQRSARLIPGLLALGLPHIRHVLRGSHGAVARGMLLVHAGIDRRDHRIQVWAREQHRGEPRLPGRRVPESGARHSVRRAAPAVVRPELEEVADVDNQCSLLRLHRHPSSSDVDLKAAAPARAEVAWVLEQNGEAGVVAMRPVSQLALRHLDWGSQGRVVRDYKDARRLRVELLEVAYIQTQSKSTHAVQSMHDSLHLATIPLANTIQLLRVLLVGVVPAAKPLLLLPDERVALDRI